AYAQLKVLAAPAAANPAVASPTPPSRSQPTAAACSHDRLVYLVEEFFTRYNAHNADALLSLFNFGTPPAGGGFESYFDHPGVPRDIRDAGALISYLNSRFTIDERFTAHAVSYPPEGATRETGNPTAAFSRTFSGGIQQGNMQLDCNAGLLVAVRMSSDYAGWETRDAFGARFSVPSSWRGPEDIDTHKPAGNPLNWLVFRDASGEAQLEVTLWPDGSADHLVTTRFAAPGGTRRDVTIADAGQTRDVIELHAQASWSGPAGAGTYDNRHLFIQLTPAVVADVVVSAPRVSGDSKVTYAQAQAQDRIAVRVAPTN
ncbi:MAG: hypothetical protein M3O91_11320, partial [Chloroflexota bacterium]|nr:hypothetical protein [Chloroflexota bacterium]